MPDYQNMHIWQRINKVICDVDEDGNLVGTQPRDAHAWQTTALLLPDDVIGVEPDIIKVMEGLTLVHGGKLYRVNDRNVVFVHTGRSYNVALNEPFGKPIYAKKASKPKQKAA